jgi:hypothetical protein
MPVHLPVTGSTIKVAQLTGETDRHLGRPTANLTESRYALTGTDLGASFEHGGKTWFLFGDTLTSAPHGTWRPDAGDAIAWATDAAPADGLRLDVLTAPDGRWRAVRLANTTLGPFEVPTGGFSANGRLYAFYTTDHLTENGREVMGRSVLASAVNPGDVFTVHYTVSRHAEEATGGFKFINVAPWVLSDNRIAGLPPGPGVLAWGSGRYRASPVHLAWIPLGGVVRPAARVGDAVQRGRHDRHAYGRDPVGAVVARTDAVRSVGRRGLRDLHARRVARAPASPAGRSGERRRP